MMYDEEAIYQDADILQAEYEREGRAIAAARKAGRCTHSGVVGYRNPTCYPEQEGLEPGQCRCTSGCGQVFDSNEDWIDAIQEAIYG